MNCEKCEEMKGIIRDMLDYAQRSGDFEITFSDALIAKLRQSRDALEKERVNLKHRAITAIGSTEGYSPSDNEGSDND